MIHRRVPAGRRDDRPRLAAAGTAHGLPSLAGPTIPTAALSENNLRAMPEERVQRRLAAILVADVVGYSRLVARDESGTLERVQAALRDVLQPAVDRHRGHI